MTSNPRPRKAATFVDVSVGADEKICIRVGRARLNADPRSLLIGFAVLMVLALWGTLVTEIERDRADSRAEWTQSMSNLIRSFQEHMRHTMVTTDRDLWVVREQYLRTGKVDFAEMDRTRSINLRGYDHIGIISAEGVYSQVSVPFKPVSLADRDYVQIHHQRTVDEPYVSVPIVSRLTGKWAIHLSRRIVLPDDSFGGVVTATMDPDQVAELYKDVDLGPHSIVALVGEDGVVRARRTDNMKGLGEDVSHAPYFRDALSRGIGSGIYTSVIDGIPRLFTLRRIPEYELVVAIGVSMDQVYARSDEQRHFYLLIGAMGTVIIAAFTLLVYRLFTDLFERRRQAESANRLKSDFLANMSHELRTPLNGILGFSEIIQRKSGEERIRKRAGTIHSSGQHLLSLVNSILDLAKIEAGRMDVYLREEELIPLVRNVVQIHEISALAKGLRLELAFGLSLPRFLRCDPTLFRQVLNNLISNAIKFTEKGSVSVRVDRDIKLGCLRIQVQDTGMGIPPESCELVFEKFRQVDQSLTRNHQGTGLGLSLAKQLVELMEGEIGLVSTVGVGTTVHFVLPMVEALPAPPENQPSIVAA